MPHEKAVRKGEQVQRWKEPYCSLKKKKKEQVHKLQRTTNITIWFWETWLQTLTWLSIFLFHLSKACSENISVLVNLCSIWHVTGSLSGELTRQSTLNSIQHYLCLCNNWCTSGLSVPSYRFRISKWFRFLTQMTEGWL